MGKKRAKGTALGRVMPMSKLKLVPLHPKRGTKYERMFQQAKELKKGQSFVVSTPKGTDSEVMRNRIGAALRKNGIKAQRGCRIQIRITLNGHIALCCVAKKK